MIGQPLHDGITEDQVGMRIWRPGCNVALHELAIRQPFARLAKHIGRGIEPDYLRLRKALDQKLGGIAGPTAEIDRQARLPQRHLREQIARRPRALVLEFEILPRAPVFHAADLWFEIVETIRVFLHLLAGGGVYVLTANHFCGPCCGLCLTVRRRLCRSRRSRPITVASQSHATTLIALAG